MKRFSEGTALTAMAMMQHAHMLGFEDSADSYKGEERYNVHQFKEFEQRYGICSVRDALLATAKVCHRAHSTFSVPEQEVLAYDWEFCGHFVTKVIDWGYAFATGDVTIPTVKRTRAIMQPVIDEALSKIGKAA